MLSRQPVDWPEGTPLAVDPIEAPRVTHSGGDLFADDPASIAHWLSWFDLVRTSQLHALRLREGRSAWPRDSPVGCKARPAVSTTLSRGCVPAIELIEIEGNVAIVGPHASAKLTHADRAAFCCYGSASLLRFPHGSTSGRFLSNQGGGAATCRPVLAATIDFGDDRHAALGSAHVARPGRTRARFCRAVCSRPRPCSRPADARAWDSS